MKKIVFIATFLMLGIWGYSQPNWNKINQGSKTTYTNFLGATKIDSGLIIPSYSSLTTPYFKDTIGNLVRYQDSLYFRSSTGWRNIGGSGILANAFVQGGNSFGADAVIGTNDNRPFKFRTNGTNWISLGQGGDLVSNYWSLNQDGTAGWGDDGLGNPTTQIYPKGVLLNNGNYINFGKQLSDIGASGFGFRDSAGLVQFKDSLGVWKRFASASTNDTNYAKLDYYNAFTGVNEFFDQTFLANETAFRGANGGGTYFDILDSSGSYRYLTFKRPKQGTGYDTVAYESYVDSAIAANTPALTLQDVTTNGKTTTDSIIAASFKRTGGTSSQFLKANGSVDNSTYLTSASLTGYVPYTGATSDVDLGAFALNSQSVKINGTNGNGHLHLRHQASDATATGQSTVLFANSNGDLKWKNDGNYYTTLQTYNNTSNRVYTYQNKSYTLADSTTLADSVSALRTAINTKGSGTVTSITLGRGITGSSPITSTGTIGLDTTKNYTWTGVNTFSPSVTASGAIGRGITITPTITASAANDTLVGVELSPTYNTSGFSGTQSIIRMKNGNMVLGANTYQLNSVSSTPKLYVNGNTYLYGSTEITTNDNTYGFRFTATSTETNMQDRAGRGNSLLYIGSTSSNVYMGNYSSNPLRLITDNITRMTILGTSGNVGIGLSSPTATLHLRAGTASASSAPLKFTSGTNLTTVENGAVEYDGTDYFASANNTRYTIDKTLRASATLNFASTAASTSTDLTITVTGAALNDIVSFGVPNGSVNANSCYTAWVSATNTVTIRFNNYQTIGAIDPASGTFKVSVIK